MTAVSQVESLRKLLREQGLGSALLAGEGKSHPPAPTGFAALDDLLGGGIPRGQVTELVGRTSSGRTSIVFAMLAESTARGEVAAYIDATDSLDPESAQKAGIALERVLWVRCGEKKGVRYQVSGVREENGGSGFPETRRLTPDTYPSCPWKAVNLVASAGGFGLIVLDLGGLVKYRLRAWQSRQWLRLRRAIENSPTSLVILASEHLASTVSALVLEVARERTRWEGTPGVSLWLQGVSSKVRIAQQRRNGNPGEGIERSCTLGIGG